MKKNWNKAFGAVVIGILAMAMGACSSEEPITGDQNPDQQVYATLSLRLPSAGTRAANNGIEYGQDDENNVGKILVVLATKDVDGSYKFLAKSETDAQPGASSTSGSVLKYTLNFAAKDLDPNPLEKDPASNIPGSKVYVFAYCNPTETLVSLINEKRQGDSFTDHTGTITDKDNALIWTPNKFLMTNCEIKEDAVVIPDRKTLVSENNKPEKAFSLGEVRVKRAAARFDFALGGENGDNKYVIKDLDGVKEMGTVELTDMAMFNIAKSFYYLPRTNSTWDWKGTTTLCGNLEGFVVSPGSSWKTAATLPTNYKTNYFCNIIGNSLEPSETPTTDDLTWYSIRPDDWNKRGQDYDEGWTPSENTDYRIWRYTTENTIPQASNGSTNSQKIGITTGVVFKGEFTPNNTELWNGNVVYVHNNIVYGDFKALRDYVKKNPETIVANDFKAVTRFATAGEDVDLSKDLLDGLNKTEANGFTAYCPNGSGKYIMYYFYYNRHLSNGDPSLMGENEFGVVRNNVYKLKVLTCGMLGTPDSKDRPDDPDEEEKAYFTVSCLVMPWTVRVNDIEF